MTKKEKTIIYFKNLREQRTKDYSVIFNSAPKDSVVYGAASAEIEIYNIAIKALEQTTWIPCNEKLPDKSGNYWCTFGGTNLTGRDYYTTASDAKETFDDVAEKYVGWQSQNVVAWMPQPKPYEPQNVIKRKAGTPKEDYTPLYNCENWIP